MNQAETRAELIDPALKESGWGVVEDTKIFREHPITVGKIQVGGGMTKPYIADYVLSYKNQKLAVVEPLNPFTLLHFYTYTLIHLYTCTLLHLNPIHYDRIIIKPPNHSRTWTKTCCFCLFAIIKYC
jgi:hypothetical protein